MVYFPYECISGADALWELTFSPALCEGVVAEQGGLGDAAGQLVFRGVGAGSRDDQEGQQVPDGPCPQTGVPLQNGSAVQNPDRFQQDGTPAEQRSGMTACFRKVHPPQTVNFFNGGDISSGGKSGCLAGGGLPVLSRAACSVVVKLMDLDPQGRWFNPWCGRDHICTAVGPLSKALNPTLLPHCSSRFG